MELATHTIDDAIVISIRAARVDAAEAVHFKDAVCGAADGGPDRVILDMEHVTFLDSSGLGALIGTMKLLAPDQQLELANLTPAVSKVFRLTRMDSVMKIHNRIDIADGGTHAAMGQAHAV